MEVEWSRAVEGKQDLAPVIEAVRAAGAPLGQTHLVWEMRRANLRQGELTFKYGVADEQEDVLARYAEDLQAAHLVLAIYPPETRELVATIHLNYDGRLTRLRVESPSLRFLTRLREALGLAGD